MENNKLYFLAAVLSLAASICFMLAAIQHGDQTPNSLSGITAALFLLSSIVLFYQAFRKKK